jgi:NADH:ubiquinone oxidoreductase subunit E
MVALQAQSSTEMLQGPLNVSIGNYKGKLPVFIDNTRVGEVSAGKPLNITVNEGPHTIKVCDGSVCEQVDINIKSAIKQSIDFGERLMNDVPRGLLTVSIGSYNAMLPVFLDNVSIGKVSKGKALNISTNGGLHSVRVCDNDFCEEQEVEITSGQTTVVDFGERLTQNVPQGPLTVSIGGYNADNLPVYLDGIRIGEVSQAKQLNLMASEGYHYLEVCAGAVCLSRDVELKFAQLTTIDFSEQLKKDVEFPKPTVRIVNSFLSENVFTVNIEFINPDTEDHTMTATIGCGYSYIDYSSQERKNDFTQKQDTQLVGAGDRVTEEVTLYLSKGSNVIAPEPTIVDVVIK